MNLVPDNGATRLEAEIPGGQYSIQIPEQLNRFTGSTRRDTSGLGTIELIGNAHQIDRESLDLSTWQIDDVYCELIIGGGELAGIKVYRKNYLQSLSAMFCWNNPLNLWDIFKISWLGILTCSCVTI